MAYLVPDTEIAGTGTWTSFGSGASNVERLNTTPTSDTSNGILTSTSTTLGTIAYGLTNPSIGVDTAQPVKIGVVCAAEDPLGLGTFTCNLILKEGGIAGTARKTLAISKAIASSPVYTTQEATLSAGEKAAITDWTNLTLVLDSPSAGLASGQLDISEIWLEYTEGAGPGSNTRKRSHLLLLGLG